MSLTLSAVKIFMTGIYHLSFLLNTDWYITEALPKSFDILLLIFEYLISQFKSYYVTQWSELQKLHQHI